MSLRGTSRVQQKAFVGGCACLIALGGLVARGEIRDDLGIPVFPGAESQAQVARAVEAYYRPGLGKGQSLTAGVFETAAPFQKLYEFYGPRMDSGKWGWRLKKRVLLQQAETLKFMRAQLLAERAKETKRLPEVFRPLFGDPGLGPEEFSSRLDRLRKENPQTEIRVVEGTRTLSAGTARGQVRVTIERPYIDPEKMQLVDKTRLVLVKVTENSAP